MLQQTLHETCRDKMVLWSTGGEGGGGGEGGADIGRAGKHAVAK